MPLESQDDRRWPAPLAGRVAARADVGQIADAIAAVWLEIDQALQPIVGHLGVAALYHRSLKLTERVYPWLGAAQSGPLLATDPLALRAALLQQPADEAAAGGVALFEAFRKLLASLIGPSLTDRLLRSVWTPPSGSPPAQDTLS